MHRLPRLPVSRLTLPPIVYATVTREDLFSAKAFHTLVKAVHAQILFGALFMNLQLSEGLGV